MRLSDHTFPSPAPETPLWLLANPSVRFDDAILRRRDAEAIERTKWMHDRFGGEQ